MLVARKTSVWTNRYEIASDGRVVTTWEGSWWRAGGRFEVGGHEYQVSSNSWGTKYQMVDFTGAVAAAAERIGRREWTVFADGRTYQFRRAKWWREEEELLVNGAKVGAVRRTSAWRGDAVADLPSLPIATQIFVLCVVLTKWDRQNAAAAAG